MRGDKRPARIVVLRTDELEALLQELWSLNPILRNKLSVTVALATKALIRETKRDKVAAQVTMPSFSPSQPSSLDSAQEVSDSSINSDSSETHPDSFW